MGTSFYRHALIDLLVALALLATGAYFGIRWESGKNARAQLAVADANTKALNDAFNEYQAKLAKQRARDKEVISNYEKELKQIRDKRDVVDRTGGLRLPASVCDQNTLRTTQGDSGQPPKGTAASVVLPESVTADLRRLAERADEVTAQCRAIQGDE